MRCAGYERTKVSVDSDPAQVRPRQDRTTRLADFQREITAKDYPFMRPGIEPKPWRSKLMEVIDPFNNQLRFDERPRSPQDAG